MKHEFKSDLATIPFVGEDGSHESVRIADMQEHASRNTGYFLLDSFYGALMAGLRKFFAGHSGCGDRDSIEEMEFWSPRSALERPWAPERDCRVRVRWPKHFVYILESERFGVDPTPSVDIRGKDLVCERLEAWLESHAPLHLRISVMPHLSHSGEGVRVDSGRYEFDGEYSRDCPLRHAGKGATAEIDALIEAFLQPRACGVPRRSARQGSRHLATVGTTKSSE